VYIAANCYSAVSIIDYPERWCEGIDDAMRERIVSGTRRQLHRCWEIFADTFSAKPYLSGAEPGALDYLAVVVSKWSGTRAHLKDAKPEFFATLERVERHPSVAPVLARHWPA
jgi:GST-like protein